MKRILFFAYYFPPIAGGGTARSAKFVKFLSCFGYRPLVLTADPNRHEVSREFQLDDTLNADLAGAQYDRIDVASPERTRLFRKLERTGVYPLLWGACYPWLRERERPWAFAAAGAALRRRDRKDFRLIYASAAPTSSLESAAWLSRRLRIPWIADLRDLWTRETLKFYPTRWHYLWESRLERGLLRSAAAIVANTPLAKQILVEWLGPACSDRVTVIPNGFDPTDFRGCELPRPRRSPTEITIVHAGTLHAPELRRSRFRRFRPLASDNAARSVVPIAKAIESLRRESPETASRIRVRLLGHVPAESREWIASIGLADCIRSEGAATHAVALEAVRSADALLVVQVAWQDASRPVPYVPGKVYEYLATGLPILAPIARGDLWDLLRGAPQAYLCDYRNVRAIADSIQRMVADVDTGRVSPVSADFLAQYDRRHLTEQLASVFDGALRGR